MRTTGNIRPTASVWPAEWVVKPVLPLSIQRHLAGFAAHASVWLLAFFELQRGRINAVAESGWIRSVCKNVAQVCLALSAMNLCSLHSVSTVLRFAYVGFIHWFVKTWPACTRVKLRAGIEQVCSARHAMVHSLTVVVPVLPCKRKLSALLSSD